MDYRQTYEILLKTICENDKRILQLLAHISQCDDMLLELSLQACPNPVTLQAITLKKDRLIEQLENASADEEQYVSQLSSIASLCNEVHAAISERMKLVLHKEDASNPLITSQLSEYQEKLEMDIRIQEVPREKRHIFYVYPNK